MKRLIEIDLLRTIAILCIIVTHYNNYALYSVNHFYNYRLYLILIGVIGVAIFFFESGYLAHSKFNNIASIKDVYKFYRGKFIRIYPLYILFILLSLLQDKNYTHYDSFTILAHILGLHALFSPAFIHEYISISWFVGVIILYYLVYPLIILYSKTVRSLILFSSLLFIIFFLLRLAFNLVDGMFFQYYFVFFAGVIANHKNVFENKKIKAMLPYIYLVLIFALAIYSKIVPSDFSNFPLGASIDYLISASAVVSIRFIIFISLIFSIYFTVKKNESKLPSNCIRTFQFCAFASYCVYLFHLIYFNYFVKILDLIGFYNILRDAIIFLIGVPVLFIICYHIQSFEIKLRNTLTSKK